MHGSLSLHPGFKLAPLPSPTGATVGSVPPAPRPIPAVAAPGVVTPVDPRPAAQQQQHQHQQQQGATSGGAVVRSGDALPVGWPSTPSGSVAPSNPSRHRPQGTATASQSQSQAQAATVKNAPSVDPFYTLPCGKHQTGQRCDRCAPHYAKDDNAVTSTTGGAGVGKADAEGKVVPSQTDTSANFVTLASTSEDTTPNAVPPASWDTTPLVPDSQGDKSGNSSNTTAASDVVASGTGSRQVSPILRRLQRRLDARYKRTLAQESKKKKSFAPPLDANSPPAAHNNPVGSSAPVSTNNVPAGTLVNITPAHTSNNLLTDALNSPSFFTQIMATQNAIHGFSLPGQPMLGPSGHTSAQAQDATVSSPPEYSMFLGRVLVGCYTVGNPTLRKPPPMDPSRPLEKAYDSCVDNIYNPRVFVVFDSAQCYPDYVIEYTNDYFY